MTVNIHTMLAALFSVAHTPEQADDRYGPDSAYGVGMRDAANLIDTEGGAL